MLAEANPRSLLPSFPRREAIVRNARQAGTQASLQFIFLERACLDPRRFPLAVGERRGDDEAKAVRSAFRIMLFSKNFTLAALPEKLPHSRHPGTHAQHGSLLSGINSGERQVAQCLLM